MKYIIFSTFDNYTDERRGGTSIAVHEVAKRLAEKYFVLVITAKRGFSHDSTIDGVVYKHIGISFGDMRLRQMVYLCLLPFHSFFRKYDVWLEAFTGPFSTAFLPVFSRKRPVIGIAHFFNGDEMRKKYKVPFDLLEKLGVRTFRYFVALTEFQEKKAKTMNPKLKTKIIPNGVDDRFLLIKHEPENILLYIGRMEVYMKGLDMLISSVKSVLEENKTVRLIFGGKGNEVDKKTLEKIAVETEIIKQIIFKGYVSEKEKDNLFSKALLFLSPSRFETFGISLLEAMSASVPAVVFDIPDFKWIPNDCVIKIPCFDVRKYGEVVQYLIDHPHEREALGYRAREFARNFSWDESARKYVEYIEEVTK